MKITDIPIGQMTGEKNPNGMLISAYDLDYNVNKNTYIHTLKVLYSGK